MCSLTSRTWENSYAFANALFNEIVDRSGPAVEVGDYYDDVEAELAARTGEPYEFSPEAAGGQRAGNHRLRRPRLLRLPELLEVHAAVPHP